MTHIEDPIHFDMGASMIMIKSKVKMPQVPTVYRYYNMLFTIYFRGIRFINWE